MIRNTLAALLVLAVAPLLAGTAAAATADWPREVTSGGTTFIVYEPQFDTLDGGTLLSRSAVSVQKADTTTPVFGAIETTATLDIDRDSDTARIVDITVDRVRFPGMREDSEEARELAAVLEREIPRWNLDLSLDAIRANLETQASTDGLRNTPPRFIYVDEPAILVSLDGEPRLRAVGDTGLDRVVNTPFPIAYDRAAKRYYFYGSSVWFSTTDILKGRWSPVANPPAKVVKLFSDADSADDSAQAPELSAEQLRRARIIVATEPTELISTDGKPALQPLVGSELLSVSNTDSDLFFDVPEQSWYIVVSGRWYRASSLTGSWSFVEADRLPASFARIPAGSPQGAALAHVAGTEQAKDAVMDAVIPQVAAVDRNEAEFEATYDGDARFEPIPNTKLHYAVNTASQVILADGRYYAVEQGVWFIGDSPYGPWQVSETRPVGLESVPASSPVYNTRYVYIYDVRPDVVYVGYTPGYLWAFPYGGTIVYGTGYRYRPWYGPSYYYPRPWTWGFSVHYSSWGGWNYGMSWNAGWLGLSWNWGDGWGRWYQGYRPGYQRTYWNGYNHGYWNGYWNGVHGGGWFGPAGYRPPRARPNRPYYDRDHRREYRPDARPVMSAGGGIGGNAQQARRWSSNLYARPENARLGAQRPSNRAWSGSANRPEQVLRPGQATRPNSAQRPQITRRPDEARRPNDVQRPGETQRPAPARRPDQPILRPSPGSQANRPAQDGGNVRPTPRPSNRPNDVYTDGDSNVYRWRGNQWQTLEGRNEWRPAQPSVGDRPRQVRPQSSQQDRPQQAQPRVQPRPQQPPQMQSRPPQQQARPQAQPRPQPQQSRPERQQAQPQVRPRDGGTLNATRERRQHQRVP